MGAQRREDSFPLKDPAILRIRWGSDVVIARDDDSQGAKEIALPTVKLNLSNTTYVTVVLLT